MTPDLKRKQADWERTRSRSKNRHKNSKTMRGTSKRSRTSSRSTSNSHRVSQPHGASSDEERPRQKKRYRDRHDHAYDRDVYSSSNSSDYDSAAEAPRKLKKHKSRKTKPKEIVSESDIESSDSCVVESVQRQRPAPPAKPKVKSKLNVSAFTQPKWAKVKTEMMQTEDGVMVKLKGSRSNHLVRFDGSGEESYETASLQSNPHDDDLYRKSVAIGGDGKFSRTGVVSSLHLPLKLLGKFSTEGKLELDGHVLVSNITKEDPKVNMTSEQKFTKGSLVSLNGIVQKSLANHQSMYIHVRALHWD